MSSLPRPERARPLARRGTVVLGCCLLATGCTRSAEPRNAAWRVAFACAPQAAASETIRVAISSGTCTSPATALYRAVIRRDEADAPAEPPSLAAGTYAFSAMAYDGEDVPIAAVCRDVLLPTDRTVLLELPAPRGCDPAELPIGPDAGDLPTPGAADASVRADAGSDRADAGAPVDSGMPVRDAGMPASDAGIPVNDAGTPMSDAGGPEPDAGACVGSCQAPVYSSPTPDISLPKRCWAPREFMPVTIQIPVTAKDWLWVKNHPDYGGSDYEFWDNTGITTPGTVYRGGVREPGGLHAPSITGSFNITWHPNDASDKEVRSTLGFIVSTSCP